MYMRPAEGEGKGEMSRDPHRGDVLSEQGRAKLLPARGERAHDRRERAGQRDDSCGGDGARPNVEDEAGAELARTHVADQLHRREAEWLGEARPHELDRGGEHQVGEAAAGGQKAPDAPAEDVT